MNDLYQYPQETWDAAECAKRAKKRHVDGLGGKDPTPGRVQGSGAAVVYYGTQRFNGGTSIDGKWYPGYHRPLPAIPDDYEFYTIPTWGVYIRKKVSV